MAPALRACTYLTFFPFYHKGWLPVSVTRLGRFRFDRGRCSQSWEMEQAERTVVGFKKYEDRSPKKFEVSLLEKAESMLENRGGF